MKPNFLGIGSARGGSTWLHGVLSSHPAFLLPTRRKETQFFTKYWARGSEWYYSFFESTTHNEAIKHVGEISPGYLIADKGPDRIAQLGHVDRFVLILRNPVERAISHYRWHLRVTGKNPSFEQFCTSSSRLAIGNGLYYLNLRRYLEYFCLEQFLILIFEEATASPESCFEQLGEFFDVDPALFVEPGKINEGIIPRHRTLFRMSHKTSEYLRERDLDWVSNLAIRLGGKRILEGRAASTGAIELSSEQKRTLYRKFAADISSLESLLRRDLSAWRYDVE